MLERFTLLFARLQTYRDHGTDVCGGASALRSQGADVRPSHHAQLMTYDAGVEPGYDPAVLRNLIADMARLHPDVAGALQLLSDKADWAWVDELLPASQDAGQSREAPVSDGAAGADGDVHYEGLRKWRAPDGWRPQPCQHSGTLTYPCQGCSQAQKTDRLELMTRLALGLRDEPAEPEDAPRRAGAVQSRPVPPADSPGRAAAREAIIQQIRSLYGEDAAQRWIERRAPRPRRWWHRWLRWLRHQPADESAPEAATAHELRPHEQPITDPSATTGAGADQGDRSRLSETEFTTMLTLLVRYAATELNQWERLSLPAADSRVYVRLAWQPQPPDERAEQYPLIDPATGRRVGEQQ
jgi:hypothetical protein